MFKSQKKVVRTINNAKYNAHTDPIFKALQLLKLDDIIQFELLKLMYLATQFHVPITLQNIFLINQIQHQHNTRRRNDPIVIRRNYAPIDRSFLCRGPILWSNLHQDFKSSRSINSFSKQIKNLIINKY